MIGADMPPAGTALGALSQTPKCLRIDVEKLCAKVGARRESNLKLRILVCADAFELGERELESVGMIHEATSVAALSVYAAAELPFFDMSSSSRHARSPN